MKELPQHLKNHHPCGCGQCGLFFVRGQTGRQRKFALDCPTQEAKERQRRKEATERAARIREMNRGEGVRHIGRPKSAEGRTPTKVCPLCANLPDRLPPGTSCRRCGFPKALAPIARIDSQPQAAE